MKSLSEGPIHLQYLYACDLADTYASNFLASNQNPNLFATINLLSALAKLGYKISPLSQEDFDMTDGTSVVHKAYHRAVEEMATKDHMKYKDYLLLFSEDMSDKDEKEPESQGTETLNSLDPENYQKHLEYHTKSITTFFEDINSYKSLNKD